MKFRFVIVWRDFSNDAIFTSSLPVLFRRSINFTSPVFVDQRNESEIHLKNLFRRVTWRLGHLWSEDKSLPSVIFSTLLLLIRRFISSARVATGNHYWLVDLQNGVYRDPIFWLVNFSTNREFRLVVVASHRFLFLSEDHCVLKLTQWPHRCNWWRTSKEEQVDTFVLIDTLSHLYLSTTWNETRIDTDSTTEISLFQHMSRTNSSTRLVCISDTHSSYGFSVPHGDILIHAGDFTETGRYEEMVQYLSWLKTLKEFRLKVIIAGNHDVTLDRPFYENTKRRFHTPKEDTEAIQKMFHDPELRINYGIIYLQDEIFVDPVTQLKFYGR